MEHRGYTGTVEYDAGQRIFHGRVKHLKDTIIYEADCVERLEEAFRDSIDAYIEACLGCEETPEPPPPSSTAKTQRRTQRGPGVLLSRPAVVDLAFRAATGAAAPVPRG